MKTLPSLPAGAVAGHGRFYLKNGHGLLTLSGFPEPILHDMLAGLQSGVLEPESGSAGMLFLYKTPADRETLVIRPVVCIGGASFRDPQTRIQEISVWVRERRRSRLVATIPARLHRPLDPIPLADLVEAHGILFPAAPRPFLDHGMMITACYPFLPGNAVFSMKDGGLAIAGPTLDPVRRDEVNRRFDCGVEAIRTLQAAQGVRHFEQVLALEATFLQARAELVNALVLAGDYPRAREELRRLLLLAPRNAWAWKYLAALNLGRDPDLTTSYLQRAAAVSPPPADGSVPPDLQNPRAGLYQFSRQEVEAMDFSHFLSIYDPARLPDGPQLAELMGALALTVDGYDDDPRESCEIPAVRKFYQALHAAWPYALYFCTFDHPGLSELVQCCLPTVTVRREDRTGVNEVACRPGELVMLLHHGLGRLRELWVRAGITPPEKAKRIAGVYQYFGLPLKMPPME